MAQRVLAKGVLTLSGSTLVVTLYVPRPPSPRSVDSTVQSTQGPQRTVEVHGLDSEVDEDMLTMFFENKRRSGGGEIEEVELNPVLGVAYLTYVKAQG